MTTENKELRFTCPSSRAPKAGSLLKKTGGNGIKAGTYLVTYVSSPFWGQDQDSGKLVNYKCQIQDPTDEEKASAELHRAATKVTDPRGF